MAAAASPQALEMLAQVHQASQTFLTQQVLAHQDARHPLFDDQLGRELDRLVELFTTDEQPTVAVWVARIAAYYYPLRFRAGANTRAVWQPIIAQHLESAGATPELMEAVRTCLTQVDISATQERAVQLLHDAAICRYLDYEPMPWASLRQLGQSLRTNGDRTQDAALYFQELLSIRYATSAGRRHWQPLVSVALNEQKKRLDKLSRRQEESVPVTDAPFGVLEPEVPVRAAQTYFRAVYRNHINLSAIADNKANIMISVNSILISVLITFLSYRNIAETQPMILLPVIIFLVVGLASLVFAVLSARPKVTNVNEGLADIQAKRQNLAFFGNFVTLSLDVFEDAMDEVLRDSSLLYGNMVRDLYHLGKVLDKKYRYLTISYNIFMVGLIVTVALFLFAFFYS